LGNPIGCNSFFHAGRNRLIDAFRLSLFGVILLSLSFGNSENCHSRTSRELSVLHAFMIEYVPKLFILYTNIDAFPTVKKLMER